MHVENKLQVYSTVDIFTTINYYQWVAQRKASNCAEDGHRS